MCFAAREIERERLSTIAAAWRLIRAQRVPVSAAAEHLPQYGYRVFLPDVLRHARAVEAGLCIYCHEEPATNGQRCGACAAAVNRRRRAEYEQRKADGICIRPGCGHRNDGETVYCPRCRVRNVKKHRERNAKKHRERRRGESAHA